VKQLARSLVELYYELNFVEEDYAEFEWSLRRCTDIRMAIENSYTDVEKEAIKSAASEMLGSLLRDPDKHGYTPRSLVTSEQRDFLEAISQGRFDGAPENL
jgi:hypothetical protein